MKANIKSTVGPFNARNYGGEKELTGLLRVVAYQGGEFFEPVRVAVYMSRSRAASRVYCSVWINARGVDCSGRGMAGGGGYHKASAAMSAALDSAGVELNGAIDGGGSSAMRDAATAIARALGFTTFHLVEFGL